MLFDSERLYGKFLDKFRKGFLKTVPEGTNVQFSCCIKTWVIRYPAPQIIMVPSKRPCIRACEYAVREFPGSTPSSPLQLPSNFGACSKAYTTRRCSPINKPHRLNQIKNFETWYSMSIYKQLQRCIFSSFFILWHLFTTKIREVQSEWWTCKLFTSNSLILLH